MMVRTFWVFLDKFIKLAGGFLVGIWVTRYLGPERFGIINQGLLVLVLCTAYLPSALKYYAIKEHGAGTPEGEERYVAAMVQLSLLTVLGVLVGVGVFLFGGFTRQEQMVGLIVLAQACIYPFSAIKYQVEAGSDFKLLAVMENIGFVAAALLKLLVIQMDGGLYWMACTYAADAVLASLYIAWIMKCRPKLNVFPKIYQSLRAGRYWQNVSDTWPLLATAFLSILYIKVDQVIVSYHLSAYDLGIYSAGLRLNDMALLVPVMLMTVVYPVLARRLSEHKHSEFTAVFRGAMTVLLYAALCYVMFIYCFAEVVLRLLYGQAYASSATALTFVAFASFTTFVGHLWNAWLIMENCGGILLKANIACISLSVVLGNLLVPKYGINGAAISAMVSFTVTALYGFMLHDPRRFFGHVAVAVFQPFRSLRSFYRIMKKHDDNTIST